MCGCFPKRYVIEPNGDVTNGEKPGYWILVDYQKNGKSLDPHKAEGKVLLEAQKFISEKDSLQEPLYEKGIPYFVFSFFNAALKKTDSIQAKLSDYRYDRKLERSQYWYRLNREFGFVVYLDVKLGKETETHRIELSNVMKSANYKPELDSLRYIYEPTAKFR
ncbi:hypothetical protein [Dyadobacter aurulentus]|uniref:hypothetical protein n=1 Tax=Dyadobacter sp. UC 10 TaxID=2605428 RepID=UPI0011F1C327|nr:hypothetical protein [Dyadobacter sp. UC 10]KAA0993085.1 hypothetical protein FXO21_24375 [Dyadobacter sp. UC 10]